MTEKFDSDDFKYAVNKFAKEFAMYNCEELNSVGKVYEYLSKEVHISVSKLKKLAYDNSKVKITDNEIEEFVKSLWPHFICSNTEYITYGIEKHKLPLYFDLLDSYPYILKILPYEVYRSIFNYLDFDNWCYSLGNYVNFIELIKELKSTMHNEVYSLIIEFFYNYFGCYTYLVGETDFYYDNNDVIYYKTQKIFMYNNRLINDKDCMIFVRDRFNSNVLHKLNKWGQCIS